ncbi:MAG: methylglyoxal synthase [Ruminococcaceae bacterium]|nr:methylglyoxal synthase [Oscillospiraceae bacterium]
MQIAIMAHEKKKELMTQFCIAYCGILSRHELCAIGSLGKAIEDATGLDVEILFLPEHGGIEQVASKVSYNEIDLLLYFRDKDTENGFMELSAEEEILHLCDSYNIPYATNIATAEALIMALERGDLDWRMLVK